MIITHKGGDILVIKLWNSLIISLIRLIIGLISVMTQRGNMWYLLSFNNISFYGPE